MIDITAYATAIDFKEFAGNIRISDAAASAAFGREVEIGSVSIIRGFIHYTGNHFSAHKGVYAVIRPVNGDPMQTLENELQKGLKNGRDDRS